MSDFLLGLNDFLLASMHLVVGVATVLWGIGIRDWLMHKGFWVVDKSEHATFRVVHHLLYDAEQRIKERIDNNCDKLSFDHFEQLLKQSDKIKKLIKQLKDDDK